MVMFCLLSLSPSNGQINPLTTSEALPGGVIDSLLRVARDQKGIDVGQARTTLAKLRDLSETDDHYEAHFLLLEGEILLQENQEKEGLQKTEEARLLFESTGNQNGLIAAYDVLTTYSNLTAQYPAALQYAFQAIEIKEEMKDVSGLCESFVEVADIYWYYGRFDKGIEYGQKAVDIVVDKGPSKELASAYKILSELHLELPDYDKALDYIDRAITMNKLIGSTEMNLSSSINSRGNIYKYLERYDEAVRDYTDVLRICEAADHKIGIRVAAANLGHVHLMKKEYEKAIPFKLRSVEIQQSTGQDQQLAENVMHLADAYAGVGDFSKAYTYRLWLDSIKSEEHAQALDKLTNELSVQYETEKKEEAIRNLNSQVYWQRISMGLGALVLAVSLFAIWFFIRLNRQLKTKNRENEVLLKEIHHRVKNNLQILSSLLSLQADHLVDRSAFNAISEGKNRVESMGLIHQHLYREADLSTVNMQEYISELCRYLESSFSVSDKDISIQEKIEYGEMDVDYAIPLGLIINELVTNAVKYAFPSQTHGELFIELKQMGQSLCLKVSDHGSGSTSANKSDISASFGSMMIETLSKKLRGDVSIHLDNGYATEIKFARF